jgi:hypothetical protein
MLQNNTDIVKLENDVLSEENSIGMKTDEVYIPTAFSIKMAEV